jgi:aryl-alcohol dehydrogenase-like predicted oxidoreductase
MEKRKLGNSGLEVSPLCLGGNVFGWTADERASFDVLDTFVDRGFDFIDTADVYSKWKPGNHGGESETLIGRWFKRSGKREQVIVATKAGSEMGPGRKGLSRQYILRAVEDSLSRLQTEYIDLYQSHVDDKETALEETLSAFTDLIKQGKVRAIGASNYSAARLTEALRVSDQHEIARYQCLQPLYNLYDRSDYESDLEAVCEANRLGVIPYYSLAAGFLTGKYRSEADLKDRSRAHTVQKYLNDRGWRIIDALDQIAKQHNATPAQISLAWLMARPSITAPIASATSTKQLEELLFAASLQLDASTIEYLSKASAPAQAVHAE